MSEQQQTVTEDDVVEYILKVLLSNLDKNEMHLEKDILTPTKLNLNDKQVEQIRELLISTNLVRSSVGFGKNGYIYLSASGINILKTYGSYRAYLQATHGTDNSTTIINNSTEKPPKHQNPYDVSGDDMAH